MSSGLTTYIEIYALTFLLYDWGNPITFVYLIFLISKMGIKIVPTFIVITWATIQLYIYLLFGTVLSK